tara:strand:- start:7 stop:1488 length:1482 start_codon:yes stop_codon:yes gene_type:complete
MFMDDKKNTLMWGVLSICVLVFFIPFAINGLWYDDQWNAQIFYTVNLYGESLYEFTSRLAYHWFRQEGRPMFGFFLGNTLSYYINDLTMIRLSHCLFVILNLFAFGKLMHMLKLPINFILIFGLVFTSLLQIGSAGLNPVAAFSWFYQNLFFLFLIPLFIFIRFLDSEKLVYLFVALVIWILSMTVYELNVIFIPIIMTMLIFNKKRSKYFFPMTLILIFFLVYLIFIYWARSSHESVYSGITFSFNIIKMLQAFFYQTLSTLPIISYIFSTSKALPPSEVLSFLINNSYIFLIGVFSYVSLSYFKDNLSNKIIYRSELIIINLGLLLLPVIMSSLSLRYQNEIGLGAPHLTIYYQFFGLAFFLTLFFSKLKSKFFSKLIIILFSLLLTFEFAVNYKMTLQRDLGAKVPWEKFLLQSKNGLFNEVNDGDVLKIRSAPAFITESFVFQGTGKKVYFIDGSRFWFPDYKPGINPSYFELGFDDGTYNLRKIKKIK